MNWVLVAIAAVALLAGVGSYAVLRHGAAVLNLADRILGGTAGVKIMRNDARYGSNPAQRIDVLVPQAAGQKRPVLVFFHGGSWNSGTPADYHFVGRNFARAGYVVVLAGYRLGPDGAFPQMLVDSAASLAWVNSNIAGLGGDPGRVFVMGHSAGAYNAMMLGLDRQWLDGAGVPADFIKGVIGLSGPYDFHPFTSDAARAAFGHVPQPAITQPIHFARRDAPPLLLATGDEDTTVKPRNSIALARAMTGLGIPTQPLVLKGLDHSGPIKALAQPYLKDRRTFAAVLRFMAQHGGVASAPVQAGNR